RRRMTSTTDITDRLAHWLRRHIQDADQVRIEGLDRVTFGHSAEMMLMTVVTTRDDRECSRDVVVRMRPKPPALLEPYDLDRQFTI
ncbi:phosphotransferase family protein, partial [Mycobacterium sp. ITM-2017-0098]